MLTAAQHGVSNSAPLALVCPSQSLGNCRAALNDRGQAALATTPSEDQQWATSEKGAHQWIDDDVITSPQRWRRQMIGGATQSAVPHNWSRGTNAMPHHGGATDTATPPHGGAAQSATPPLGRATQSTTPCSLGGAAHLATPHSHSGTAVANPSQHGCATQMATPNEGRRQR